MRKVMSAAFHFLNELIVFLPVLLIVSVWIIPEGDPVYFAYWCVTLFFTYFIGYITIRLWKNGNRLLRFLLMLIVLIPLSGILHGGVSMMAFLHLTVGVVAFIRGGHYAIKSVQDVFPMSVYWIGLSVYFVASVIFRYVERIEPFLSWMYGFGFVVLVLALFVSNSRQLQYEASIGSRNEVKTPSPLKRSNLLYTVLFLGSIFMLAALGQIRNLFIKAKERFVAWLHELFQSAGGHNAELGANGPAIQDLDIDFGGDVGETRNIPQWLETGITYFVIVIVALAAVFIAWFVIVKMRHQLKKLWKWLQHRLNMEDGGDSMKALGYEDEKESLFQTDLFKKRVGAAYDKLFGRFKDKQGWKDLKDNKERARYLYYLWVVNYIRQGYAFETNHTTLETADHVKKSFPDKPDPDADELVEMYNSTRYGEKEPPDAVVEKLRRKFL